MEQILVVFHQYETGLRSGTIKTGVSVIFSDLWIMHVKTDICYEGHEVLNTNKF